MLLEPVAFPMNGEKKTDTSFLDRKAETVIESARQLSRWCDVYKAEFPGTLGHESEEQLRDNLLALSECSQTPWVLLSAGVDFDDYIVQVRMAMDCGAIGHPRRPGLLEGILPAGRRRAPGPSSPPRSAPSGSRRPTPSSASTAPPGSPSTG